MLATDSPESATMNMGARPWAGRILFAVALVLLAMLSALLLQIDAGTAAANPQRTIILVLVTLAMALVLLAFIVIRRAMMLWRAAKDGLIGTRLQSRIIFMFCVIAILPTIIVSVFSALFFNYGVASWFDSRVSSALENSVNVANAYLQEHKSAIRNDAMGLAGEVQRQLTIAFDNPAEFQRRLTITSAQRGLSEAVVFDRSRVVARTALSFSLVFERMPEEVMDRTDAGQAVIIGDDEDQIQAVVKISDVPELYLMVSRVVDPTVLEHMKAARATVVQYRQLQHDMGRLQQQFFAVFILVALLILLASIWAGMMLAARLIGPITQLMAATERVRAGDYSSKVPEGRADDEIANLGRTFNRMTGQLEAQRRDLMEANRQLDERRRFTEAVLSGVSAGIIALDEQRRVVLHNGEALELLNVKDDRSIIHRDITALLPELSRLLDQAERKPDYIASTNMVINQGERRITLHVQVSVERFGQEIEGYIVTFDDITALVSAQRNAAWADVARRIAHEIKNPLTPITLSVDRLRRKFSKEITSDAEAYERYLDTISRHVRDIGRMVEEFVSFARMPAPVFREDDVAALVRKAVFSEQTVNPDITYVTNILGTPVMLSIDDTQLGQVFLNLLKNAAEALETKEGEKRIDILLRETDENVIIEICDNGPGFPEEHMQRLTEPYVTTRTKGTGLGLAIVKRNVEEHKGTLDLSNRAQGGACVTLTFPRS